MIDVSMDTGRLDELYRFTVITDNGDKPWGRLVDAADKISGENGILSVRYQRFDDDHNVYIMTKKDVGHNKIRPVMDTIGDTFTFNTITAESMQREHPEILVQLLLNAIGRRSLFGAEFNNLSGKYLCVHRSWMLGRGSKDDVSKARGFKALEFKVEPSSVDKKRMILGMHVTTFNRARLFGNDSSVKWMAKYDLKGLVPIRTDRKDGTEFVNKSIEGERNLVEFLSFRPDEYGRCKIGIFNSLVQTYNSVYNGVSRIDIVSMSERERISPPTRKNFQTALLNEISKRVSERNVCLIDLENDRESKKCREKVSGLMRDIFDKDVIHSDSIVDGAFNLCIVHDKEFHSDDKENDPYNIHKGKGIQHLTVEEISSSRGSTAVINVLVKELIIKEDIKNGKISLYDWSSLGLPGNMTFKICHMKTVKRKSFPDAFYSMTIHPDGSFEYERTEPGNSRDEDTFLWEEQTKQSAPEYVVRDWNDNACVVRRTNLLPIPDDEKIRESLKKHGREGARGQVSKENNIHSILDLWVAELDGGTYYVSGYNHHDLNAVLDRSPNIRQMEMDPTNDYIQKIILELMNVPFVRYNQLTVAPFPIKYLREIMEIDGINERPIE